MTINILKKYWWVILLIIIVPIIINCLILKPAIFKFVGKDTDWLNFWGAYIGTVLSSFIAFYVLHKQLAQNNEENKSNRNLQISVLKYQIQSQWLTELKAKMVKFYIAFNQNDITMLGDYFIRFDNKGHIIKEIKRISEEMKNADFAKGLLFPKDIDSTESKTLVRLHEYEEEFNALLEDLNWIAIMYDNQKFKECPSFRKEIIHKLKSKQYNNIKTKSKRIWDIIDSNSTKISLYDVANIRIKEGVSNIPPDKIIMIISELIDYEQEKINKIIQNNNETEQ